MWFRNPDDIDWHYYAGAGDSKARRLACGKPFYIKPGARKSPLAGQPTCVKCAVVASRPPRQDQAAPVVEAVEPRTQPLERTQTPRLPVLPHPESPRPRPLAPIQPAPNVAPGVAPGPGSVSPKPSYRWVRENARSIWHYLASADAPGPICGVVGAFGESRYNLPAKTERCLRCGQEAARITKERVLNKRGAGAPAPPKPGPIARLSGNQAEATLHPQPLPPITPATPADLRLEQLAAAGRRLSHLIEVSPDRPFTQAFAQLPSNDQEIIQEALRQRVWSDLFLSPTAQKAAKAAREANRPPNRAANAAQARNAKRGRPGQKPNP